RERGDGKTRARRAPQVPRGSSRGACTEAPREGGEAMTPGALGALGHRGGLLVPRLLGGVSSPELVADSFLQGSKLLGRVGGVRQDAVVLWRGVHGSLNDSI